MAAPDGSLKRQAGRKPAEKAKLLVEYAQLPADKGGWKVGAGALCRSCPAVGGACPAAGGYVHPCIQLMNSVSSVPGFSEALETFYTVARDVT